MTRRSIPNLQDAEYGERVTVRGVVASEPMSDDVLVTDPDEGQRTDTTLRVNLQRAETPVSTDDLVEVAGVLESDIKASDRLQCVLFADSVTVREQEQRQATTETARPESSA